MHVDGGVTAQVFLAPATVVQQLNHPGGRYLASGAYSLSERFHGAALAVVARRLTAVARGALESLVPAQSLNDLYRLEVVAQREERTSTSPIWTLISNTRTPSRLRRTLLRTSSSTRDRRPQPAIHGTRRCPAESCPSDGCRRS